MTTRIFVRSAVEHFPGMHFRELLRVTGLAVGQLQHHLHTLTRAQDIVAYRLFRHVRYCVPQVGENDRVLLGVLRLPVCRAIITHLLGHEGTHCQRLSRHAHISPSTFSWYVARLERTGLVRRVHHGRKNCVHLSDPERVRSVLADYRETFLNRSVRGFMDAWRPR